MRLHHHPFSSNARRAVMTAHHLGALSGAPAIELVTVDLTRGQQRSEAFLALNPNGRVPVLEDDGLVLTESRAIMIYLAENTPGQTVYPTEVRARADVNRWLFWCAHHFTPAVSVLNWENLVKPMLGRGAPDPREVARGEALVTEVARLLDLHLASRTWMVGDRMTLADLSLFTPLMTTVPAKLPVTDRPHLARWFRRMSELESWRATAG